MKHLFTTAALLFSMTAFAQVGINNTSPKATLDITAKTSGTKPEGLIIPQLSGDQIRTATAGAVYGTNQKGLIVYASSADTAPAGATAGITAAGYYYFDGTNWQKMTGTSAADATTTSKGIVQLAGDLAGTATSPTVSKIQSKAVSSTAPTNGQVLKYNTGTSAWEPAADTDTNTTYTAGSGMTLTGTSFSANDATTSAKGIVQLAGDLAGTATSPTVAKIQSKAVSSTAPTNGQVLKYNTGTSSWEPAADTDTNTTYTAGSGMTLTGTSFSANDATTSVKGIVQLAGDLAGTATSPTVAKIQNKAVSSTAPTNGQVLKYNTGTSAWEPAADTDTNTTYTAGSGLTLTGTSFSANDATTSAKGIVQLAGDLAGTAAAPSIASSAVTSAKIADGAVTASKLNQMSATSGQVLGWNGSSWAPTASDTTNDAWINDTTNGLVKLGTKADGTARAAGTDFVVKDNGQVGIGTSSPSTKLEINSSSSGAMKIVDGTQGTSKVLTSDANGLASWSFSGVRTVRVAATGARNTSGTYSLTPGGVIVYTIENLDVDNAYNSTTGVFTAPRDGYYTFEVATYLSSSNTIATNAYVDLVWSANTLGSYELGRVWEGYSDAGGFWFLRQGTNTMFLTAGQTIKVIFFQGGTNPVINTSISSYPNTFGLNRLVITY
ncbi:hypothetical protein [Flavobacterium sp. B17]|uniref:hypothetical protein n=1 Tax=Flavobacterium sp. B17 TaxID=95618 RepID=UPI000348AF1A|nr:hypothetical protein [Flavobacterium sp. B17]